MPPHLPLPSWIEIRSGRAPVLLLAPHGGRRHDVRQPGRHKVNDLHTAELTRALAAACDATCVVNATHDRNEIDLNRITQVRRSAPWLPPLLAAILEQSVARAGHATVLVLHGWNVVQPACDVGIGLVETSAGTAPVRPGSCTATRGFVERVLPRLRDELAPAGVVVTVGARYPAAHPNNLLQIFTAAGMEDADPALRRIAALAAAGKLDAAQLELGIPLRWPGATRETLIAALARVFGAAEGRAAASRLAHPRLACGGRVDRRRTLQFVAGELIGLSGIDADEHGGVAGRLLLSPEADRLALFTGELADRAGAAWHVPPLRFSEDREGGWQIRYGGPLLSFPMLTPFLDLENGLAHGHLLAADVALAFRPLHPGTAPAGCFGTLRGRVVLGERRFAVETEALLGHGTAPAPRLLPSLRVVLPGTPLGHLELLSSAVEGEAPDLRFALAGHACAPSGHRSLAATARVTLGRERGALALELRGEDGSARRERAALERLIPVRRPGRPGTVVHTIYALCRGDHAGGWLELSTEHTLPPSAAVTTPAA